MDDLIAARDRLLDLAIAVRRLAPHSDEQRARRNATRVVFNAADLDIFTHAPQHIGAAECFSEAECTRHAPTS